MLDIFGQLLKRWIMEKFLKDKFSKKNKNGEGTKINCFKVFRNF